MISSHLEKHIEDVLRDNIIKIKVISGGDINNAAIIHTKAKQTYFIKWNDSAPENMFEVESKGLALLRDADCELIIPDVIAFDKNCLVLSLLTKGDSSRKIEFNFGKELARLHKNSSTHFGLNHDNYIGKLSQKNDRKNSWAEFFISQRIAPQITLGIENNLLPPSIELALDSLKFVIEQKFPNEPPALLHGDLWSGNYMFTTSGVSIYDPAVYFGHREMDLAMTRLFGGFSSAFYDGYESEYPLQNGHQSRIELCNLYPLLVHANLFGGSYVHTAERIINNYTKS